MYIVPMRIQDIGEFQLIDRIRNLFDTEMPSGVLGIGDDCAIVPREVVDREILITSDLLVEGTHFRLETTSAEDLGYKTLAVNVSDVSAMGGRPQFAFLSLVLPPSLEWTWVESFLKGFRAMGMESGVCLLGGDTTRGQNFVVNVTLIGSGPRRLMKRRSEAQPGDIVAVTGPLGDSAGGLSLLSSGNSGGWSTSEEFLVQRHLRPRPHLQEGLWLGRQSEIHAMMDVSDGIGSDLMRLSDQSGVGFEIELECLPSSAELTALAEAKGWDINDFMINGGEDYVLLVTVDAEKFERLYEGFQSEFQRPLTPIGKVIAERGTLRFLRAGAPAGIVAHGYDHFARRSQG